MSVYLLNKEEKFKNLKKPKRRQGKREKRSNARQDK